MRRTMHIGNVYLFNKQIRFPLILRFFFFFLLDIIIITFSLYISLLIRFEFIMSVEYLLLFLDALPLFLVVKLSVFACFRIYNISWRYIGFSDIVNIAKSQVLSMSLLMVLILIPLPLSYKFIPEILSNMHIKAFPRSIFFIDGIISFCLFCGLRVSKRLFLELFVDRKKTHRGKKTLIIGAGNTGEMIIRDMKRSRFSDYYPVGLLDDDKNKIGTYIHGVKVFDTINTLDNMVSRHGIESIIL